MPKLFGQTAAMQIPIPMPWKKNETTGEEHAMAEVEDIDFYLIELELGEGAMRFARKAERSLEQQLEYLAPVERRCCNNLKRRWDKRRDSKKWVYPDEMYLRFAQNTSGRGFKEKEAWKAMKKLNVRFLLQTARNLEEQLLTKVSLVTNRISVYKLIDHR
jgi:hypothetical protein